MVKASGRNTKVSILSVSFILMCVAMVPSILGDISKAFPDAGRTSVQLIMSLGTFSSFAFSFIAGNLSKRFSKKKLELIAMVVLLIAGCIPILFHQSLTYLYASGLLAGAACGTLTTVNTNINNSSFDGSERHAIYGYQTTSQNIGSVVIKLLAGILAGYGWYKAYYSYAIVIPVFFIVLFLLPMDKPQPVQKTGTKVKSMSVFGPKFLVIYILALLSVTALSGFTLNISMYMEGTGLGTSATAAILLALWTGMAAVSGLVFPVLIKKLNRYVLPMAFGLGAIGAFLLMKFPSMPIVVAGVMLLGLSYGFVVPTGMFSISQTADADAMSTATGTFIACVNIGSAIAPLILNPIRGLWSNPDEFTIFLIVSVLYLVLVVLSLLWAKITIQKPESIEGGSGA